MSFKSFFSPKVVKKEKVVAPSFEIVTWSEKNRLDLNQFMRTETGDALFKNLRQRVSLGMILACTQADEKACAKAKGSDEMFSEFIGLYKMKEIESEYKMDKEEVDRILNARLQGSVLPSFEL